MKTLLGNKKTKEIWRSIRNHSYYQVSNYGRVKRLSGTPKCNKDRILKTIVRNGYAYADLCKNAKITRCPIHRLVLETFHKPQPIGTDPDHKNNNRLDNRVANLQWISINENRAFQGEKNGSSKLKEGEVWLIKKLLSHKVRVKEYMSKMFKVHPCTIGRIKSGNKWKHIT